MEYPTEWPQFFTATIHQWKHNNPVMAGLVINPEDYYYSSAAFYESGVDHFGMLTHYMGDNS